MPDLDPTAIKARIKARAKDMRKTLADVAADAGLGGQYFKGLGRKSLPRLENLEAIARALEVAPEWLAYGTGPKDDVRWLRVIGTVEAGAWQEPRATGRRERLPLAPDPRFPAEAQYLLEVRGTSMNRVFPPGALLHCLDVEASGIEPRHGDIVVVEQTRADGEIETTAKRLARRGARLVFAAESDDPAWAGTVIDPAEPLREGRVVAVRARAVVLRTVTEHWR